MSASPILASAYWIVLLPFIAGALIILLPFLFPISRDTRKWKTISMLISIGAVTYGFLHSVAIFSELAHNGGVPYITEWLWFQSASFRLTMGLLVDNLASVMLIVVTMVSLLVQIYTHAYMREDPGYSRFYAYLSLFTGSMLGLVIAPNLFQMFYFWELVGVCSYFLIGFWFYKPSAAYAAIKAFVVNRIGDFGFLVGILMFLYATYGFWTGTPQNAAHGILTFSDPATHVDLTGAIAWAFDHSTLTVGWLTVIAGLMFMGPMAKSAQAPLHVWLPDAMEGPTPISALIHAATMVAAGVYMVARAYPIWLNWANPASPTPVGSDALAWVAWVGAFTAFMAATIALTQFDIKRALAWSTVSQLGYMFVGLGVGAFSGGIFHLFNHAFFKAMLFLCSGAVIHALHGEQDMRKMGGLLSKIPFTGYCFLIGTISISGVPLFSGFFSKDDIIGASWNWTGAFHAQLCALVIFTAGLTAFYMFRMYFMTFTGEYRGEVHPHEETGLTPLNVPLCVLAVPSIISGYLGFNWEAWVTMFQGAGKAVETPFGMFVHWGAPEALNGAAMACSSIISIAGILIAFAVYQTRTVKINETFSNNFKSLYEFSFNRWYWDNLYHKAAQVCLWFFSGIWTLVDKFVIDNAINYTAALVRSLGGVMRYSENGRGQSYAMAIFGWVSVITLFVYFQVVK